MAQGEWNDRPGAIAAGAGRRLMLALDGIVPQPATYPHAAQDTVRLSGAVPAALNSVAVHINPAAVAGPFRSPFARLSFADKVTVWRILDDDTRVSAPHSTESIEVLR